MKKVKNELSNNLRYICLIVVIAFGLIGIVGSGGGGGHSEYLTTVSLTAEFFEGLYDADVTVKVDTSDPADEICDIYTFYPDNITITITSTTKPNLPENVTVNPVKIMSYTVEYIPREEDSPAVPTKSISHELVIQPDTSVEFPVRVIDQEDKMSSSSPLNYIDYYYSGAESYEYTVIVTLTAEEVLSGQGANLKVEFPLNYLDLGDECFGWP